MYDETNDVVAETKGGRPRSTSSTQDQKLVEFAEGHEEASSADIARSMTRKCGELSPRSVRRRLNEAGLQSLRPTFAPLLNKKCRKARLAWAKENKTTNWNTVLFSDESTFETNRKITRVWRRRGEVVARGTVKHPVKVQVWGCLTSKGFGQISCFSGNLNAKKLRSIYRKTMLPSAEVAFGKKRKWTLQEDNDPKHVSVRANNWKKENGVVRMNWPSQSPDMNPIEHVWAILKANVANHRPNSKKSLIKWIRREWKRLPSSYAEHLIQTMDRGVNTLIRANGDNTPN